MAAQSEVPLLADNLDAEVGLAQSTGCPIDDGKWSGNVKFPIGAIH